MSIPLVIIKHESYTFGFFQDKGDRYYIVSVGQTFTQVSLCKRVVEGLAQFNSSGFKYSPTYDMKFVKVLLIACIGRQKISVKELDPLSMGFIKGV